ncbi:uncharacterized protein LOC130666982 [Microplitis mediator]|uniref:uncharacterized protein LOC130666982 n=1 Tax=Microplitis mediator TaxID=375433 RepID=UPI0025556AF8|nr:uncharacterized protein LOC130666982 [Microplitis mediator]
MSRKIEEEQSPFLVPSNVQLFGFYQWNEAKRRNKKGSKSVTRCVKKYPVIKEKETSIVAPTAITDVDPGYFTDLAGRPIREKFSRRKYVEQVNKVLKTRLVAGYNRDHCIRIDQQFDEESKRFSDIEDRYREYSNAFEKYLSDDHEASMKVLEEADQEARNSSKMISKRDRLFKEFGQVRLEVYQWREMWRDAKMCHDFIRKVFSPPQLNAATATAAADDSVCKEDEKSDNYESESFVYEEPAAKSSLECLVESFEEEISDSNLGSGDITVEDPLELSRIFSEIESRNLDALIHLESLAKPMEEMTTDVAKTEELIKKEIGIIEENIKELQSLIEACEQRAANLKAYADYLLQQVFRELVCSESVLYLQVFIEDTYESCVGPNHAKLDGFTMMRTIEKIYESLNMTLDNLPADIVRQCEKEGFTQEIKIMREAEDAAQKFNLMHRLLAALERIMEPPEFNLKTKTTDKDDDKSSKHDSRTKSSALTPPTSSRSSLIARQKNLQLKQLTMPRRSRGFFSDDKSLDSEIQDLTFEFKKLAEDRKIPENLPSDARRQDCRDSI